MNQDFIVDTKALLNNDLLQLAIQRQRTVLATNPKSVQALKNLADCYRKLGDLESCKNIIQHWLSLDNDNLTAQWYYAALVTHNLAQVPIPKPSRPAPFIRIPDFLDQTTCDSYREYAIHQQDHFVPAGVGLSKNKEIDLNQRSTLTHPVKENIRQCISSELNT